MARKKKKLDETFLINHAREQYQRSMSWRTDGERVERWKADNDLYDSKFPTKDKKKSDVLRGQGKLFIPKTYSHVQRMLVDVLDTFFFDPEEIIDISSWKNLNDLNRDAVKTLLNYRLNGHPINIYNELYELSLDALKNGAGIFKVYPKIKTDDKENITSFAPIIECVPYEDVFFDSRATWKDYWKYPITHRMVRSLDYLKRKGYKNLDKVPKINAEQDETDEIKMQRSDGQGSPFSNTASQTVKEAQETFVYEIWTFLDVNNDGLLESCSYLMAGDQSGPTVLIRDVEENDLPYKQESDDYNRAPFTVGQAFPESHQMYGKSLPQVSEGLQKETNALRNQRREAVALALRKPLMVSRNANIDLMGLVNRRVGGVVLGDDVSPMSVRELDIQDATTGSAQEQAITNQDYYETTSIPPDLMGMPSSGDQTATGVTTHTANANKKIAQVIKNISMTGVQPAFEMFLKLEQAYETDEFIELVTGRVLGWQWFDDGIPARETIQGDFELKVNIGINKQLQLNKLVMIMDRANLVNQSTLQMLQAGAVQPDQVHFVNQMELLHRMLKVIGEKDVDAFMTSPQQPPQQEGQGAPGIASQARQTGSTGGDVVSINPEATEGFYGAG